MVQVEHLDDATEIVTDPRFGPPEPSWFEENSRQPEWGLVVLSLGLALLFTSSKRHRRPE